MAAAELVEAAATELVVAVMEGVEAVSKPAAAVKVGEVEGNKPVVAAARVTAVVEVAENKPVAAAAKEKAVVEAAEVRVMMEVNVKVDWNPEMAEVEVKNREKAEKPEQKPAASTATNSLTRKRLTLRRRPLFRPTRQAIPAIINLGQRQTSRRLTDKEVIRKRKILKLRKLTYTLRNCPGKHIMTHIQLLQANHLADLLRQRPQQLVEAHISHIPNARRQTPVELIIRHHNHRHRRIPKIIRQFEGEPVMVYENRIQRLVKQGRGNRPFELIEPDVQIDQLRQAENHVRELPGEPVVTHVQLVQPLQILEFLRDRPAEPVRVEVENREIRQQAELLRQESGYVAVVEVNAGDRPDLAIFRRPIAKHVGVVTHVRPDPIRSKVARI
nr:hypothetical protein TorRG33x02_340930 [Ipomoea batatas]